MTQLLLVAFVYLYTIYIYRKSQKDSGHWTEVFFERERENTQRRHCTAYFLGSTKE